MGVASTQEEEVVEGNQGRGDGDGGMLRER